MFYIKNIPWREVNSNILQKGGSSHRRCSVKKRCSQKFRKISKNTFFTEHLRTTASEKKQISLEFSLRSRKWLCIGLYKPNQNKSLFLGSLNKALTKLAVLYGNFILLEDFSLTTENKNRYVFNLKNLINKKTNVL